MFLKWFIYIIIGKYKGEIMKKIILIFVLLSSLFADTTLKFSSGGEDALKFYYGDDQHMRLTMYDLDGNSDIYVIGKKSYIVSYDQGRIEVVDLEQMRAMMGAFGAVAQEAIVSPFLDVTKKGKHVKIAGINAEQWWVQVRDEDSQDIEVAKVLVTKQQDVVHAMRKLSSTLSFMPSGEGGFLSFFELERGYVMIGHPELKVLNYSRAEIDPSIFLLPNTHKRVHKTHAKPQPIKRTITKERRIKKCKRFSQNENDGSSGSMKYSSPKCVEWYYEVETYEVEVENKPKKSSGFNNNSHNNSPLGSDNPLGGFKGFF